MDNSCEEISVSQIQEIHYNKLKKRVDLFDKPLKQCYRVIRQAVSREETYCMYTIPEIIFGNPLYNIPDCANYIYRSLRKNGFDVKYLFPNHLIIIWTYKNSSRKMIDYPIQLSNQSMIGGGGAGNSTPIQALPPPAPVINNTVAAVQAKRGRGSGNSVRGGNGGGVGIEIFKRNSFGSDRGGGESGGRSLGGINTTKEYRPTGSFLFTKKK